MRPPTHTKERYDKSETVLHTIAQYGIGAVVKMFIIMLGFVFLSNIYPYVTHMLYIDFSAILLVMLTTISVIFLYMLFHLWDISTEYVEYIACYLVPPQRQC